MFGTPDMHPPEGRWPTKEELRKRFARPINETINELGEGRGPCFVEHQIGTLTDTEIRNLWRWLC